MGLPALVSKEKPGAFGPYELVEQLGQGGMAIVYRARQRGASGFSRDVVLKAMLPALVKSQPLVEMFETEARLTAQLRHPNIVQVEDYGVAAGIPYLIMEFLDGKNLSQLRNSLNKQKRRAPIGVAVSIVRDLCLALGYAHHFIDADGNRMQVIHRDISPSNVMVLRDGSIRLLDFGVAKLSVEAGQAVTTSLKGKFAYMAPEQVNQEPIDCRCDVFAAGIVLHELLTGKRLFGTRSELETLRRVSAAEAAPPSVLNKDVPPELDAVVMRALSRDRESRFDSGTEMAAALEAIKLASARREIASLVGELFPVVRTRIIESVRLPSHAELASALEDGDTEISHGVDEPFDGITSPERAVSAPHLVLLPGDEAIVGDAPDSTDRHAIEMEAEPSGIHASPTSLYNPGVEARNTEPHAVVPQPDSPANLTDELEERITKRSPAAKKAQPKLELTKKPDPAAEQTLKAQAAHRPKDKPKDNPAGSERAFPAEETMAAPLDEIRPTRIYDPTSTPALAKARENDFDGGPTSVFDGGDAAGSARGAVSGVTPDRGARAMPDPEAPLQSVRLSPSISVSVAEQAPAIALAETRYPPADNSMFEVRPETTRRPSAQISTGDPARPRSGSAFLEEAPPTVQAQVAPKPKRGSMFIVGGLLGAMLAVGVLGGRAYLRHRAAGATVAPKATSLEPANAPSTELAAPSVEPRLPSAVAPTPPANGPAVSLVGLDKKPAAAVKKPDGPSEVVGKTPKTERVVAEHTEKQDRPARKPERIKPTPAVDPVPDGDEPREAKPTKASKAAKAKGSVKDGRIVDPFEDGE